MLVAQRDVINSQLTFVVLKQSRRIHGRPVLKRILDEGSSKSGHFLNVICIENSLNHTRYATLVGKKLAPSAVVRNRKRRQIYEIIHILEKNKIIHEDKNLDIILMVRKPAMTSSFSELIAGIQSQLAFLKQATTHL